MKTIITILLVTTLASCSLPTQPEAAEPSPPPVNWHLPDILKEVYGNLAGQGSIIAWMIKVDNRPLYVESFIAVTHYKHSWRLTHLWRHPRSKNPNSLKWQEFMVFDAPSVGSRVFDHKPKQSELLQFLDDTWWKFTVEPDWQIRDTGIDSLAWQELTGEGPPSKFMEQIKESKTMPSPATE
jgi:hypothetical protein